MTEQNHISRNQLWTSAWVGQELMMMSGTSSYYLSLSETGGRIWDLLAQPTTVPALCHALAREYDAEPEQIQAAVYQFLEQMLKEDAIAVGHGVA